MYFVVFLICLVLPALIYYFIDPPRKEFAMNLLQLHIGSRLAELRELLGWTQDNLAGKIGLSRTMVLTMEKDPARLDRMAAISLFTIVSNEMANRRNKLEKLTKEPKLFETIINTALQSFLTDLGLTPRFLSLAAASYSFSKKPNSTYKISATAIAVVLPLLFSALVKTRVSPEKTAVDHEDVKEFSKYSFSLLETKILDCLGIPSFDLANFLKKLDASNISASKSSLEEEQ